VRLVLDTNLLVSGVISAGLPRRFINGAKAGEFELCTSDVPLAEPLDVLSRAKFAARLGQAGMTPQGIVDALRRIAVVVSPVDVPRVVPTDPDDDHVIAAAVAAQADLIASGDERDLLPMTSYQGIPSSPLARRLNGSRQEARLDSCDLVGHRPMRIASLNREDAASIEAHKTSGLTSDQALNDALRVPTSST
jgi:uncharacterized protein